MKKWLFKGALALLAVAALVGAGDITGDWFYADGQNEALDLGSAAVVRFSSTASGDPGAGAAFDVGFKRDSAGYIATTNGSSGSGGLIAATIGPDASHQMTLGSINGGTIVTTAGTQTLTNKTLTAPVVNGTVTTTGLTMPAYTEAGGVTFSASIGSNVTVDMSAATAAWLKIEPFASSGSTTPALGTTCPASSGTVHWWKIIASDGTVGYVPVWE